MEEEHRKGKREGEGTLEEENISIGSIRKRSDKMEEEIRREGTNYVEDVSRLN